MRFKMTKCVTTRVLSVSAVAAVALVMTTIMSTNGYRQVKAARHDDKAVHSDSDHDRYEAALKKTMIGHVDIYFDVAELEVGTPRMAKMKFLGLVDVTGKHLLRFVDSQSNLWLVDPDTVLTYRIRQARND
jgi:hypothetical protein